MIIYKISQPTTVLNKVYLPGIFLLNYDWSQLKKLKPIEFLGNGW